MMTEYLEYPQEYLNLSHTLTCGQSFRWKVDDEGWWAAPVRGRVIRIREADSGFLWETLPGEPDFALVSDYFRLDDDVRAIYAHLARSDEHMAKLTERFRGLRLLRQEPAETILSYICSAANSVPRIAAAVEELSQSYGHPIARVGGLNHYCFPELSTLAAADPDGLARAAGLGWRGSSIAAVAKQILSRPIGWLESLRSATHDQAKSELLTLRGIGAKIADCVCLFALDKDQAVPVDTHVRQVTARLYLPDLKARTVTPATYDKIVRVFRERFGPYAGWAQEFLYYEDLLRPRAA
jgi:N-glycosylase/DNA lyase